MANSCPPIDCGNHCCEIDYCYTQVVVIGNGPSGISLSNFLSGNWPYYNGQPHCDQFLQARLMEKQSLSIIEQDLEFLSNGLEGRSANPVSLLFDNLHHPNADMGTEDESCLDWVYNNNKSIPHVVLGTGPPGGAWQKMDETLLTLSLSNWMELPGIRFKHWLHEARLHKMDDSMASTNNHTRANVSEVAQYYKDYIEKMNLQENFYSNVTVTSVKKLYGRRVINSENGEPEIACQRCRRLEGENLFEVKGLRKIEDEMEEPFCILAPNVVIATGTSDDPNRLRVPGENLQYVSHSIQKLEEAIVNQDIGPNSNPVLIVGAGLSAADAILFTQSAKIPVIHIFRRKAINKSQPLRSLPKLIYPEYNLIYNMMTNENEASGAYNPQQEHSVVEFKSDKTVVLKSPDGIINVKVSHVCVLIGSKPKLTFLPNNGMDYSVHKTSPVSCKWNPLHVDPYTMESNVESGMYAIGPLVGDNFVRFLQGGALAVASHLVQKKGLENQQKQK